MNTSSDGAAPAVCTACGSQNRDGARFCGDCGVQLAERCRSCGTELVAGARFCDSCGAAAQGAATAPVERELRKTVTVLFADVVGSTSLQETLDTEAVRRVMTCFYDTARAAIEGHEGQVVKFTGDGVMAAFGTPIVREDDALRGVRAAHALVADVAVLHEELTREWGVRLDVRTGVNTGEVVAGAQDGDLIGDPVNVAARLEQAAGKGEVLIGEQTERLVRRDVQLEPVAALVLKGKAAPVPAFRLVAVAGPPGGDTMAEPALVGRGPDLGRLRAAFDAAVQARSCSLVTVIGSPGIGKTRLADELGRSVAGEATVLAGRCEASDGGITFAPVAEILRAAAGIGEGDAAGTAREKLMRLLPPGDESDVVAERALGVLGAVPAASTEETFWGVRRVLEELARGRPLVLVLDDVHWGQPTYLDLVEHLAEWVRDVPVLLVALARPELRELRDALVSGRAVSDVVELDPLGAADSRTLVDELLGNAEIPESLAERVLRATEGNPLFVAETVRMLVDEGVLAQDGASWVVARDSPDVEMPPTIHALIAARLERLGGDERSVVEGASVIGKQFYRGAVADLCARPVGLAIDVHLEKLRRKELVQPEGTYWIDEPVFRFHHALIRDAAYRSVLKEARAELHERFADWLQSKAGDLIGEHEEVVAFHLEQAHRYREQLGPLDERGRELGRRAAERLGSAGRRALAREDLPAASNLLARALERMDPDAAERPELLIDLAETLVSAGDTVAAAPVVEAMTAVAHASGGERLQALASVYATQLGYLTDTSHLHEAVDVLAADAGRLAALGDEAGLAKACHVQAGALAQLGQVGATEAALDRALDAARGAGDTRRVSAVLAGAPLAALWGPSTVVRASGRCLDVVRILRMTPGNRHLEASALSCQAVLEAMRGRPAPAREMLDGCRATFEELGLRLELLENEVHAGIVELLDDQAVAAETRLRRAYDGFGELGAGAGLERAEALLARALLNQDRDEEADALTLVGEERGGEDLKATIAWCGARAQVLARRGEHVRALELAQRGAEMADATDALTDHADARMALAAVLRATGDDQRAAEEAQQALDLYRRKENDAGARQAAAFLGAEETRAPAGTRHSSAPVAAAEPAPVQAGGHPLTPGEIVQQYVVALNSADWDALGRLFAPDLRLVDHRLVGWGDLQGREAFVTAARGTADLTDGLRVVADPLVVGRAATVARLLYQGRLVAGGGPFEIAAAIAIRVEDGTVTDFEIFDVDDTGDALVQFERTGAQTEPERLYSRVCRLANARDWTGFADLWADDFEGVDHRAPAVWGVLQGPSAPVELWRTWTEVAPDAEFRIEVLAGDADRGVLRVEGTGNAAASAGGGPLEYGVVVIATVAGGRIVRNDWFGSDDAALAHLAEPRRGGRPGTPRELVGRYVALHNAHDWDGLAELYTPALRFVDHRLVGWGELEGRDAFIEIGHGLSAMTHDLRVEPELLVSGAAAYLVRFVYRGSMVDGGGAFEIAAVALALYGDSRVSRFEIFEASDGQAAFERFEEIGAQTEPERQMARTSRLLNTRDWDGLRAGYAEELTATDHRALGWEPMQGPDAVVDFFRSWTEIVPDAEFGFETLATDDQRLAYVFTGTGHAADGGGRMEYVVSLVSTYRDGLLVRSDTFDAEDRSGAIAHYEELRRSARPPTPREATARYVEAVGALDWGTLTDFYAPGLRFVDHRMLGWGELEGRGAYLEILRGAVALASEPWVTWEPLLLGLDSSLVRFVHGGRLAEGGGEFEVETLALSLHRDGQVTYFEVFEGTEVAPAIERFEEVGAATDAERNMARFCLCVNTRDLEGLARLFAPDYAATDHRTLGWEPASGPEAMVKLYGTWVQLVPDMEVWSEMLAGDEHGAVFFHSGRGHAADGGGEVEYATIVCSTYRDGLIAAAEIFDADDRAGALARYEELRRDGAA